MSFRYDVRVVVVVVVVVVFAKFQICPLSPSMHKPNGELYGDESNGVEYYSSSTLTLIFGTNPLPPTPIKLFDDIFTKFQICPLWR